MPPVGASCATTVRIRAINSASIEAWSALASFGNTFRQRRTASNEERQRSPPPGGRFGLLSHVVWVPGLPSWILLQRSLLWGCKRNTCVINPILGALFPYIALQYSISGGKASNMWDNSSMFWHNVPLQAPFQARAHPKVILTARAEGKRRRFRIVKIGAYGIPGRVERRPRRP